MSKTVEQLLKEKYVEVKQEVSQIVDISLLPTIEDVDLLNIIDLMLFLFPDNNTLFNLNELIAFKEFTDISDEQKDKLVPIIDKYLIWLQKLKQAIN